MNVLQCNVNDIYMYTSTVKEFVPVQTCSMRWGREFWMRWSHLA